MDTLEGTPKWTALCKLGVGAGAALGLGAEAMVKLKWSPRTGKFLEVDVAHDVKLSDYSIAKYETTWFEFDTFLPATGRTAYLLVNGERLPRSLYNKNSEDWGYVAHPAETTWQDAKAYCAWLAEETGRDFDLPTSAQWDSQREIAGARTGFTPHMTESR